ncbi:hypothetical protein CBL_04181 [Carabus blaptoides fortunei]
MVKLKNKQISLEKNENEFIKYIKTNCDIGAEYEWNQLKNLSDQELHKMRNDIVENFKALQNIKSIGLYENVDKLDLNLLKNTMLSFENNLQIMRDKINSELVNLSKTENALNIDIINIEIKLSDMNKKIRDVNKVTSQLPKNILEDEHIYQEVKDYTIFLTKSGGHEEKLKHWKLEKERKCQQFLEWEMQNSIRVKEFEKQKRLEQIEKKKEVEKWKSIKTVKERADKLEKEILTLRDKEKKTSLTNKLIREFQCQDNLYIRRRLSKLRISVAAPRIPTLKTNCCNVDRDPERIFKATQQWVNRITPEDIGSSDNIFARNVSVKQIPKLAVPKWRKIAP